MKGFGKTLLILCIIGGAISLLAIFGGNQYETANGVVVFGSALAGMLMYCILITLADIREIIKRIAEKSDESSPMARERL
jgi:uncharacterized integral membrane protein